MLQSIKHTHAHTYILFKYRPFCLIWMKQQKIVSASYLLLVLSLFYGEKCASFNKENRRIKIEKLF